MHIQYHGHSCIQVTEGQHSVIIDPYITGNQLAVTKLEQIHVQHILLTHGHFDHITDAVPLAKQNNASIIAAEELTLFLKRDGVATEALHIGGSWQFPFGLVYFTPALHESSVTTEDGQQIYTGSPIGIILQIGGITLYHAGDTGLFTDMRWLGERFAIDVAFLPIGNRFTMGPEDALIAAEWLNARCVVPIHYDTFPPISQDAAAFVRALEAKGIQGKHLLPGDIFSPERTPEEK